MKAAEKVDFTLGKQEALVLFEMLADFRDQSCLDVRDSAQRLSLVRLHGALESVLVETFLPDYGSLIDEARSSLAAQAR